MPSVPRQGRTFDLYGPELGELIEERVAEPQELVMGRRTYEMLGECAGPPESNDPLARRMDELPKTVLMSEPGPTLRISSDTVVRDLAAAQLLDQLRLVLFPLVLGPDGEEPIFADHLHTNLELESSRVLDGRLLALDYRPLPR